MIRYDQMSKFIPYIITYHLSVQILYHILSRLQAADTKRCSGWIGRTSLRILCQWGTTSRLEAIAPAPSVWMRIISESM